MYFKRIAIMGLSCVLLSTSISYGGFRTIAAATTGEIVTDDFETDLNGWGPRGDGDAIEVVELTKEEAHGGKQSVKVSNRSQTWHGPMCNKTEELAIGETYNFGVWLKYKGDSFSGSHKFSLQIQYSDGVSDQYKTIKSATVQKGQWTQIQGEFTIPTDAENVNIYVESEYKSTPSAQDLMDIYVDDFTAKPAVLPEIQQDIKSLKEVYESYFKLGCAATATELAPAPAKDLVKKHYNSITFGNELKPDAVLDYDETIKYMEANDGDQINPQVNIRGAKTLLEFAKENKIPVRGHTLVWHSQTPDWFFKKDFSKDTNAAWVSKEVMLQRMENYIKNLMELIEKSYPTVEFYAWDVVNEAVNPNTATGMREPGSNNITSETSAWMKTVGKDFIVKAFEYARKYAPEGCKLFYNDYNEYEDKKSEYIYDILKELKEKKLVDGMGMQSHWIMEYPNIAMFEKAVRKYDSLGLEIQLTELDIKQPDNSSSALAAQASRYKMIMDKTMELKKEGMNITAVVFWGITDATSWLGGYPLLFDGKYQAKPAFYSITDGVKPMGQGSDPTTPGETEEPEEPGSTEEPPVSQGDVQLEATVSTKNSSNSIGQKYEVVPKKGTIDLSKLKLEFTADEFANTEQNVWCDNVALQLNTAPWHVSLTSAVKASFESGKLMITFDKSEKLAQDSGKLSIELRIAKKDWSKYEELTNSVLHVYYDGQLVK